MCEETFEQISERRRRERGEVARMAKAGAFVHDGQLLYAEDIGPDGVIHPRPVPHNDFRNDPIEYANKFFGGTKHDTH